MTARGPLFEVADDDDDDEDKKLSAKATTKVTQSGQVIPSEEGQAGVFDDQEVVNLVFPKAQLAGRGRGQRASEHIWFHLGAPSGTIWGRCRVFWTNRTVQNQLDRPCRTRNWTCPTVGHLDSIPGLEGR